MADPYEAYAKAAHSRVSQPQKLIGVISTRAAARLRYSEIVDELNACEDADTLSSFLASIDRELIQFRTELDFYWEGDGDFAGLAQEIQQATARCDGPGYSGDYEEETRP
jgi:hypothetical protein